MSRQVITPQEARDLEYVYNLFDGKSQGLLDIEDLMKALRLLGFKVGHRSVQRMVQNTEMDSKICSSQKPSFKSSMSKVNMEGFIQIVVELQATSYDHHEEIMEVSKVVVSGAGQCDCAKIMSRVVAS